MLDQSSQGKVTVAFDVASASSVGKRSYQQDTMIVDFPIGRRFGFAIIADGMGGHAAGGVASTLAASEVFSALRINLDEKSATSSNLPLLLREAAETANMRIATHVAQHDETSGMGTTLLVPVISGDKLSWISIGDSPLLLFRDGALRQLNKDHSMAPQIDMMVKTGSMTPEMGRNHPDRSVLTSVLDGNDIAKIDCPALPVSLIPGDVIIAASDGVQSLPSGVIANVLSQFSAVSSTAIASALMEAIDTLDISDQDNVTVSVVTIGAQSRDTSVQHIEEMPVLAMAGDQTDASGAAAPAEAAPEPEPAPEPEAPKKKTFMYRGQVYTRD